jgi:hypothetical protein
MNSQLLLGLFVCLLLHVSVAQFKDYECKNLHEGCEDWASIGHCELNPTVKVYCPKSCGLCKPGEDLSNSDLPSKCLDTDSMCPWYARVGNCEREDVLNTCKRSCRNCDDVTPDDEFDENEVNCEDTNVECYKWSTMKQCEYNSGWMLFNCRKSCKNCDNSRVQDKKDPSCKDLHERCLQYAVEGECQLNPGWMESQCPFTCGKCGKCRDMTELCRIYAKEGQCTSNAVFLKKMCPKSCGACE